jgi:hypothetical protein
VLLLLAAPGCCDEHTCSSRDARNAALDLVGDDAVDCGVLDPLNPSEQQRCVDDAVNRHLPFLLTRIGNPWEFTFAQRSDGTSFVVEYYPGQKVTSYSCSDSTLDNGLPNCAHASSDAPDASAVCVSGSCSATGPLS